MTKVTIIIPCYNEHERLDLNSFIQADKIFNFIFVNDGSTDNTQKLIDKITQEREGAYSISLDHNIGKGHAVMQGVQFVQKHAELQTNWVGYLDADLSTPLVEILFMIKKGESEKLPMVVAIRHNNRKVRAELSFFKVFMTNFFNLIVRFVFPIDLKDTQCGAKIFKIEKLNSIFDQPFLSSWLFDIELILRCRQENISTYYLSKWSSKKNGKFSYLKEFLRILKELVIIRFHYR